MTVWQPEPLVRAKRKLVELTRELDSIDERRHSARRGLEELDARYAQKSAEVTQVNEEIKEWEKKV
jgi:predicted  nucleic acid-binding Zn-ribbon protein